MADLLGGGEALNVVVAIQRLDKAIMELEAITKGTRSMRPMPGILGVLASGAAIAGAFPHLPVGLRNCYLGCLDQPHSSPSADRLADQVRGDGD